MMTKKDFEAIAYEMRDELYHVESSPETDAAREVRLYEWRRMVSIMADVCAASNGRFNRGRFVYACER